MIVKVIINGSHESLFPKSWGMDVNPFPQIGRAEYEYADRQLSELSRPNQTVDTIRDTLRSFHPEFTKKVVTAYRPHKVTRVAFDIPDSLLGLDP